MIAEMVVVGVAFIAVVGWYLMFRLSDRLDAECITNHRLRHDLARAQQELTKVRDRCDKLGQQADAWERSVRILRHELGNTNHPKAAQIRLEDEEWFDARRADAAGLAELEALWSAPLPAEVAEAEKRAERAARGDL